MVALFLYPQNTEKMKAFFEAIAYLFQEILFIPLNLLRELELTSWFLANGINWVFLGIGFAATTYWIGQLKKFNDSAKRIRTPLPIPFYKSKPMSFR